MRVLLFVALLCLIPVAGALNLQGLPAASEIVPRIVDPASAQGGTPGPVLAPTTGAVPMATPQQREDAVMRLQEGDAYAALVQDLAQVTDAEQAIAAYWSYGARMGWAAGPPSSPEQFGENSTISYTHDIGDVDRDGVRDIALDVYCAAVQGCPDFSTRIEAQGTTAVTSGGQCQRPHVLMVVSGRDGHPLRNMSLDAPHAVPVVLYGGCSLTFVIGTLPLDDGTFGVVLYTMSLIDVTLGGQRIDMEHVVTLLDMKTGEPVWAFHETGYHLVPTIATLNIPCTYATGHNILLNPLLQKAPVRGVSPVARSMPAVLDIQGVGYNLTLCTTWTTDGIVFQDSAGVLINDYDPDEWMARLNITTGVPQWRVNTFQPEEAEHSVIPRFLFQAPLGGEYPPLAFDYDVRQIVNRHNHYWNARTCCYDLTGDGIPDFAATTLEFTDTPMTNVDALYGFRSRLVVFDGADGHRVSATVLVEDTGAQILGTTLEGMGDADGDGQGELLVRIVSYLPYYRHILSVRHVDGSEAWRIDNPRDLDVLVIGDANRDGGNDLLLVEWVDWEGVFTSGQPIATPFTNVTHLPLKIFSGVDGGVLWKRDHFGAVIDYVTALANLRSNGIPDLNGDGVADILVDDPTFLPDRTVIHRLAFVNPRNDRVLTRIVSVGAFAMPALAGDSDGDGREDLVLLNGDINDLWLTLYTPDGKAEWSRRIATPRLSGYASAVPSLRTHEIDAIGRPGEDLLLNFQLSYTTVGSFIVSSSLSQQLTGLRGGNGTLIWAAPGNYDANITEGTRGASPATALFTSALARDEAGPTANLASLAGLAAPGVLAALLAAVAGFFAVRRLRL